VRTASLGDHLLGVAVIGRYEKNDAETFARFPNTTDGHVGGLDGLDGSLVHTRVANHVWRRKIAHDKLVFVRFETLNDLQSSQAEKHHVSWVKKGVWQGETTVSATPALFMVG
jgi:hypothetical protein